MDRLILAAALFVITYIFMIKFVNHRPLVVGISALVFIILNIVPLNTVWGAIDFNRCGNFSRRYIFDTSRKCTKHDFLRLLRI